MEVLLEGWQEAWAACVQQRERLGLHRPTSSV
jgi:hypothetical protein